MIIDSPIISGSYAATGSLNQTGNVVITGSLTVTGTINGSITGSITTASYALNAEALDGLDSTSFTTTSSFTAYTSSTDASILSNTQNIVVLYASASSLDSRVTRTEATASSLTTASSSFSTRVTSNESNISSLQSASGSFSTRTTNLETASGSFSTRVSSNESNISSLQTASGSFSTRVTSNESNISALQTASGSFSTRVTSTEGSVSSLNSKTGSYATTSSNAFSGSQTITGSLTVTGQITAQTLVVQQVTSSIVYSSGSNIFGNSLTNTQQFTGSASVTGSLIINNSVLYVGGTNIGIGVTNPNSAKLVVYGSAAAASNVNLLDLKNGSDGGIKILFSNSVAAELASITAGVTSTGAGTDDGTLIFSTAADAVATEKMRITSGGNVGIGTTSPSGILEVVSSGAVISRFNSTATNGGVISFQRSGTAILDIGTGLGLLGVGTNNDTAIYSTAAMYLGANGTQFVTLKSGNVGIGTTSPATKLHISNNGAYGIEIDVANEIIQAYNRSTSDYNEIKLYSSNIRFFNGTSSTITERMRITSGGSIGIGTTSPSSFFHVNSGAVSTPRGSGFSKFFFTGNNASTTYFEIQTPSGSTGDILFSDGASGDYGIIGYDHANDSMRFYTKSTINMFISGSGLVGIGTTSPDSILQLGSKATSTQPFLTLARVATGGYWAGIDWNDGSTNTVKVYSDANNGLNINVKVASDLQFSTNNSERMRILSGGSVGIGTTSPSSLLHAYSSTTATQTIANFAAANYGSPSSRTYIQIGTQYGDGSSRIGSINTTGNQSALIFQTQTATSGVWNDAMYINGSGLVGIGTTSPATRLHIEGNDADAIQFRIKNNSITNGNKYLAMFVAGTSGYTITGWANSGVIESAAGTNSNFVLGNYEDGPIIFQTNNRSEKVRITSAGFVGIGTTSPTEILHLRDSLSGYCGLRLEGTGTYAGSDWTIYASSTSPSSANDFLGFYNNSTADGATSEYKFRLFKTGAATFSSSVTTGGNVLIPAGSGLAWSGDASRIMTPEDNVSGALIQTPGIIRFNAGGSEKVRITSGGLVGIGTTSPGTRAEIYRLEGTNRTSYTDLLTITAAANTNPYSGHGGGILFKGTTYVGDYNWGRIGMELTDFSEQRTGENMFFEVAAADNSSTLTRAMTIQFNGNIGIGTTSPAYKLDVIGSSRSSKIFINTTTDYGNLNIIGYDNSGINIIDQRTSTSGLFYSAITFRDYYLAANGAINFYHNQYFGGGVNRLGFAVNGTDHLTILHNGNVGIGNTSPQGLLEVGVVSTNSTYGGHFFSTFTIPVNTWTTVFTAPNNTWAAITEFTWTSAADFNRSGAAYMRWAYEAGGATLGVVYTLFNNSQNSTATFRNNGGQIQVNITGGAANYYVQVRIQGSQAA